MGAFSQGITKPLAEGIDKYAQRVYDKFSQSSRGEYSVTDFLASMRRGFNDGARGPVVESMIDKGIQKRNQILQTHLQPVHDFQGVVKTDRNLALQHDYSTASISQIHNSLPQGHAGKNALSSLMANPDNHGLTLNDYEKKVFSQANMYGRDEAFGPGSSNLAATLYPMLTSKNPTDITKAESWLGVMSQIFRDTEPSGQKGGGKLLWQSGIKSDVLKSINSTQKAYNLPKISMEATPEYKRGGPVEGKMHQYAMTYLAPFIAMAHLADFFKLGTVPAQSLVKTLFESDTQTLKDLKMASGIMNHTIHSIYDNDFKYRTGTLSKLTGQPDAAAMIQKTYHNPLFHNVRMLQLSTFGSAGYHSAQLWGEQAARTGNERAIAELKEMRLEPKAIIARGGKLTDEELEQAIWHYTNNRLFIDKPLDRARVSGKSPFFRVATMFHGYITKEGNYLTNELMKLMKANDYVGIGQFAATVGVIFPACAPLLYSLETLVRTASPQKAEDQLQDDYASLLHPQGFGDFTLEYLKLLAHFGAAGAFMQYVHAASNHRMAAAFAGPVPGVGIGTAEDTASLGARVWQGKQVRESYKPLARDLLRYYTLPIFGNWAAEHMLPKKRKR
jgi:hypothetical protein